MDSELPGYSEANSSATTAASTARSQKSVSLEDAKGLKWLTLTVNSRASAPNSLPVFYEGEVISGQVDFDVVKSESIKGISIKVNYFAIFTILFFFS